MELPWNEGEIMKRIATAVGLGLLAVGTWMGHLPLLSALFGIAAGATAISGITARKRW